MPKILGDESEDLENFDECILNDINPVDHLKYGPKCGLSKFISLDGKVFWRECEILSYTPKTKKYLIKFLNSDIKKEVNSHYFSNL